MFKCIHRVDGCIYAVKKTIRKLRGVRDRNNVLREVFFLFIHFLAFLDFRFSRFSLFAFHFSFLFFPLSYTYVTLGVRFSCDCGSRPHCTILWGLGRGGKSLYLSDYITKSKYRKRKQMIFDSNLYIQTELCEGGTLEEELKTGRKFSESELKEIVYQVVLVCTSYTHTNK